MTGTGFALTIVNFKVAATQDGNGECSEVFFAGPQYVRVSHGGEGFVRPAQRGIRNFPHERQNSGGRNGDNARHCFHAANHLLPQAPGAILGISSWKRVQGCD